MELETDVEIVRDNVLAVQAIFFAYALDEMRMFQVVDRIAELYAQGLLPIGDRHAGDRLRQIAVRQERLTEAERRSLYARALGVPGGDPGRAEPNREFVSLWLRFLVAVSAFARQHGAAGVLAPPSASNAAVRDAARTLAVNASTHGAGMMRQAAKRLANETREAIEVLQGTDVMYAYGARDMWQVIDRVNDENLGGRRNVPRYRTLATGGSAVLQWLADHIALLEDDAGSAPAADEPALVEAVERVLAATGAQAGTLDLERSADDLVDAVGLRDARGAANERLRDRIALFQGSPGTGKTLAAFVLAHALATDVLRVDLAQVVSQHIGDTEKNLDRLFDRAGVAGAILFFDEADALFGRRGEVKDAHDRYANLHVAYLLQRIAEYEGLVIVATNRDNEIDAEFATDAWRRRHAHVVRFPRNPR